MPDDYAYAICAAPGCWASLHVSYDGCGSPGLRDSLDLMLLGWYVLHMERAHGLDAGVGVAG